MNAERVRELAAMAVVERASGFREFDADLFANLIAADEREAIIQTIDELDDDRHPMFAEGYRHALQHIREFIEGREEA